jgi:hypothetical protein
MVHFWSDTCLYTLGKELAPVIDDVALYFGDELAVVRVEARPDPESSHPLPAEVL